MIAPDNHNAKISRDQDKRLEQAYGLIADVQIEMLRDDEDGNEEWRTLFRIRAELNRELYRLRG